MTCRKKSLGEVMKTPVGYPEMTFSPDLQLHLLEKKKDMCLQVWIYVG